MSNISAYFGETLKSGSGFVATADYSGTTNVAGLYGPKGVGGYSSGQFQFVTIEGYTGTGSSSASNAGVVINSTQGAGGLKVLGNKPQQGDPCQLFDVGEVKVIAGAAMTIGQVVMSDANGRAIPYVDNGANVPVGECRVPANQVNDVCTIFIWPNFTGETAGLNDNYLDTITAHAGGGQASAVQLVYGENHVSVVATSGDSVALPAAVQGAMCFVVNDGANTLDVYSLYGEATADTIDGTAGTTPATVATTKRTLFMCLTAGKWLSLEGTKTS